MKILKDPFAQFLTVGALIFLAYGFTRSANQSGGDKRIAIDRPTQVWLYNNFKKQFRRSPSRIEMGALIKGYIEQEVKYREALAIGLDERDSIVRRRMMQKFDFLFGAAAADVVPEEDVLRQWLEANPEEFTVPAMITFSHHWFSPDDRGDAARADATAALANLQSGQTVQSDPFPFETAFEAATKGQVRSVLGEAFADAVFEAPLGDWSGPLKSGLGYHLVRVTQKTEPRILPFEEVRELALQNWREVENKRILAETLAEMKGTYDVEIDEQALIELDYALDAGGSTR